MGLQSRLGGCALAGHQPGELTLSHIARQCIERTKTTTGLRVTVRTMDKVYQAGRKYTADFKQNMKILFDDHLPKWNYRAVPEVT